MKKFFLFASALIVSGLMTAQNNVATFEDVPVGIQDSWVSGANTWKSGDYTFTTYKDDTWGAAYYYAFVVSNETESTSTGWEEPYRSASGGAHSGDNFAVWYFDDWYGNNSITFDKRVVPGFYCTNNAYTVNSMMYGDGYARAFTEQDTLYLHVTAKLEGKQVDRQSDIALAIARQYLNVWKYIDLSDYGEIDEIEFSMTGTDNGASGLNTPAYVCIDDFGAENGHEYYPGLVDFPDVSGIEDIEMETVKAQKILLDGQLLIKRDRQLFNAQGIRVK